MKNQREMIRFTFFTIHLFRAKIGFQTAKVKPFFHVNRYGYRISNCIREMFDCLTKRSFFLLSFLPSFIIPLGIPYASPPVGKLRFMPPVTPSHWSGVRSAHVPGPVCPQKLPDISNETLALRTMTNGRLNVLKRLLPQLQNQSEDCLYLNIFAPATGK